MQIAQLIEALRTSSPVNFIWGSGCSSLYRPGITFPADRAIREAVKKYDADALLSEIKRKFFHITDGLEDAHSCLLALNDYERRQVLYSRTNWANICMAELLRIGRAARVLTTNFDGSLVRATATFRTMLPLYRREYPELRGASTPCIYLLGDEPPETLAGLLQRGSATGPWIVIGASGRRFGLSQALLSVERYEQGLYWIGHFHEEPPSELRDGLFTPQRNAHWITGFDADSFMAYLLRGLGEIPPPGLIAGASGLKAFESQCPPMVDLRPIMPQLDRIKRASRADVKAFLDKLAYDEELAFRAGRPTGGFGIVTCMLAEHRSPNEVKSVLIKAADLMEADAPGDVMGRFSEVCCKLAHFSLAQQAVEWYARADDSFEQMDFGPSCGAPLPYGHPPKWAQMLTEWACFESHAESDAIFARAREKFVEVIGLWAKQPLQRRGGVVVKLIGALQQRARMLEAWQARPLLQDARQWLEELRADEITYGSLLALQLFREAEAEPDRQTALVQQAEAQFQILRERLPDQAGQVLANWATALGELGHYDAAELKFQEVAALRPDWHNVHKNWSSILLRQFRARGRSREVGMRARQHAELANVAEPGAGSYNLACFAAETSDREGVAHWLSDSAEFGKIARLSHILHDESFVDLRREPWFQELLDTIFDAGFSDRVQTILRSE